MGEISIDEGTVHLKTVEDWVNWAQQQFIAANVYFGHGTDNAWDEAVHVVLHAMHLPLDSDQTVAQTHVSDPAAGAITKLVDARIKTRKPLAYLINEAWFAGLPFYVDERVIVPRSPFAQWLECHFSPWVEAEKISNVLDMGTGSACMAIAAALAFPKAAVDAIDIDADALAVAKMNVKNYDLQNRVTLYQSDCFADLPTKCYDIIMSNPPYVSAQEMQSLPAEYLCEPRRALEAKDEGLSIVLRILCDAKAFLADDGILVIEVGNGAQRMQQRYPKAPFVWLEQERGGHGLLLVTAKQLTSWRP